MINKRGVSEVVSVVLIILISISLVSIMFVYIMDYASKPLQLSPQNCINMQSNPPITIDSACYHKLSNNVEVKLSRSVDNFDITSLKLSVSDGSKSSSWSCSKSCNTCSVLSTGEKKFYYVLASSKPIILKLTINDCSEISYNKIDECKEG